MSNPSSTSEFIEPTHYELQGPYTHIGVSKAGAAGVSVLVYRHLDEVRTFRGDEIRINETEIGVLVTVTMSAIPDLETVMMTVILPVVNVSPRGVSPVETHVLFTTERTSIGGPGLVEGQIQGYEIERLSGRATAQCV